MTETHLDELNMDNHVPESLLGRLAIRLYPQHLERFATTQLGIKEAKYFHLIDGAGHDSWRKCFCVLLEWYNQEIRKMRDLCTLLREAERLGFVQKGTRDDLVNGKVWDLCHLDKCHTGPYPDFANMVAPWYTDPIWQNMLLFPWMEEEALQLSKVYTAVEMECYIANKKEAILLTDYKDLFSKLKSEGNRILVKGDPGSGKTTFVHKVTFDWATGGLDQFDVVLVTKLRFACQGLSIEKMIKQHVRPIGEHDISDDMLREYLTSGRDRVLLILDGLDEVNLKHFPQIQEILAGRAYRKCTILLTSRPNATHAISKDMTRVTKLRGFSRQKAEQFVSHVLEDPLKKKFFQQLQDRGMVTMYQTPLVVQALALLFRDEQKLPATYTVTYDELVFFLRKTCEVKGLTENEIKEAMDEVNELAFKGLTREDKQLVFYRDEIKNENVFKLGILSGEKSGSGFRPTNVLQFPHKTVQEHSAADHVTKRLLQNDRGPWETLKSKLCQKSQNQCSSQQDMSSHPRFTPRMADDDVNSKTAFSNTVNKFKRIITVPVVMDFCRFLVHYGAFEEEPDIPGLWDAFRKYPTDDVEFEEEERRSLFDFLVTDTLCTLPKSLTEHLKAWTSRRLEDQDVSQFVVGAHFILHMIENDPERGRSYFKEMITCISYHSGSVSTLYANQDFEKIWESVNEHKILFTFLVGKLPHSEVKKILREIAELTVQKSFDESSGNGLDFHQLQSFMQDLMREREDLAGGALDLACLQPVLLHLNASAACGEPTISGNDVYQHTALRISGSDYESPNVRYITKTLKQLKNVCTAELEQIRFPATFDVFEDFQSFAEALYQSPVVSLQLTRIDSDLVSQLLENLPTSTQRLFISDSVPKSAYLLPAVVNLVYLYIENCQLDVATLLRASFPFLKKLHVILAFNWSWKEVAVLRKAVNDGRMPHLQDLRIRHGKLKNCGPRLVELLSISPTLMSVDLLSSGLSMNDGKFLLASIQKGEVNHITTINLIDNKELSPIQQELQEACNEHQIELQIDPAPKVTSSLGSLLPLSLSSGNTEGTGDSMYETGESTTVDFDRILASLVQILQQQLSGEVQQGWEGILSTLSQTLQQATPDIDLVNVAFTLGDTLSAIWTMDTMQSGQQDTTTEQHDDSDEYQEYDLD